MEKDFFEKHREEIEQFEVMLSIIGYNMLLIFRDGKLQALLILNCTNTSLFIVYTDRWFIEIIAVGDKAELFKENYDSKRVNIYTLDEAFKIVLKYL